MAKRIFINNRLLKPQSWPKCDINLHNYIFGLAELLKKELLKNLTGVYLHGSLATGSYFPPKSDIDFLVVAETNPEPQRAKEINLQVAHYAEQCPVKGSIELSMITRETARDVPDQMPYILHYSGAWHEKILGGKVKYGLNQIDPDLPAHLMCIKKRGVCICGLTINAVFGDVSQQSFLNSVLYDFNKIKTGENIFNSPYYSILNICRVMQIFKTKNLKILNKFEGAIWGMENLPFEYKPLIEKALYVYSSPELLKDEERKTGGVEWDRSALMAFRKYAAAYIKSKS